MQHEHQYAPGRATEHPYAWSSSSQVIDFVTPNSVCACCPGKIIYILPMHSQKCPVLMIDYITILVTDNRSQNVDYSYGIN